MSTIDIFTKRVDSATKSKSKEIRLSIDEAQKLLFEITELLSKENLNLSKIIDLQNKLLEKPVFYGKVSTNNTDSDISMDGGRFK